jgi:hypothetical protein
MILPVAALYSMKYVLVEAHVVVVLLCELPLFGLEDEFDEDDGEDTGSRFIAKATPNTVAKDTAPNTRGRASETPRLPLNRDDAS